MKGKKEKPRFGKSNEDERGRTEKEDIPREVEKAGTGEDDIEERLRAAESKAKENYDRALRVMAEFENYKKRAERDQNDFRKFANESLIKEILPIIDNLERALEIPDGENEKTFQGMREGVEMTLKGLLDSLKKHGVVPIESLDRPFDPRFHHAVMQEESERRPDNTVSQELQKGYIMHDRLLRPAMVVVSKKPGSKPDAESEDSENAHKIDVTVL